MDEHRHAIVKLIHGDAIETLRVTPAGVDVTFEHSEPRRFDLVVVGADGPHSRVRALTRGAEADFVRLLGYYLAVFEAPGIDHPGRWERFYNVPGKVAAVYPTGRPD